MNATASRIKVTVSPSKSLATVRVGRLWLEVWLHGGVTRLVPADNTLCGCEGTHYTRVPAGTWEEMATAAIESWQSNRADWKPCE